MLKKLKDIRIIIIIVLVLFLIIGGVFFYMFKTDQEEALAAKDSEIAALEGEIAAIGELVPAYTVAADVPSGKEIEESDLTLIDVPLSMATNLVQDSAELVGKHFKLGMTAGSVITSDCVYEEVITSDMRYYDLMVDVVPIGLQEGSFVDIRIRFGTGADYVGITHRQVVEINGNCLKLILTEEDIQVFSSMLVDMLVFSSDFRLQEDLNKNGRIDDGEEIEVSAIGSYLYAVEYVEGGIQEKSTKTYAPSEVVQAIMSEDPNILDKTYDLNDSILLRNLFNATLKFNTDGHIDFSIFADEIADYVMEAVEDGREVYEERMEAEMEAAEEAGY